jgi:hypothetical protein
MMSRLTSRTIGQVIPPVAHEQAVGQLDEILRVRGFDRERLLDQIVCADFQRRLRVPVADG